MLSRANVVRAVVVVLSLGLSACEESGSGADAGADPNDAGRDAGTGDAGTGDAGSDDAGSDDAGTDDAGTACSSDGLPARWTRLRHHPGQGSGPVDGQLAAAFVGASLVVAAPAANGIEIDWYDAASLAHTRTGVAPLPDRTITALTWLQTVEGPLLQVGSSSGTAGTSSMLHMVELAADGAPSQPDGGLTVRVVTSLPDGTSGNYRAAVLPDGARVLALYGPTFGLSAEGTRGPGTVLYTADGGVVRGPTRVTERTEPFLFHSGLQPLADGGVLLALRHEPGTESSVQVLMVAPESGEAADAGTLAFGHTSTMARFVHTTEGSVSPLLAYRRPQEDGGGLMEVVTQPLPPSSDAPAVRFRATEAMTSLWFDVHATDAGPSWGWNELKGGGDARAARYFVRRGDGPVLDWTPDAGPVAQGPYFTAALFLESSAHGALFVVPVIEEGSWSTYAVRACSP